MNKNKIEYALSAKDIKKIFKNKIKILLYSELSDYDNIVDVLEPYGRVAILYYWEAPDARGRGHYFGHWQNCFINCNGNIEVFNSFGGKIDDTLKQLGMDFRRKHNEEYKYLTKLLLDYPGDVEYNKKQLQGKIGSATCGRWICYRMLRDDLNIDEFNKLFTNNVKMNDQKIVRLIKL